MPTPVDGDNRLQHLGSINTIHQFAALVNASPDAIIGHTLENVITYWNRGAERLYGHSVSEALGCQMALLLPAERYAEADEICRRAASGEHIPSLATDHITHDGSRIDVDLAVIPVKDEAGRVICAWTHVRDITLKKQTELELKQLQQDTADRFVVLETANRVALDILASRTGVEALRHIAEAARTLSHAKYAALCVARADGAGLLEFVTTGLTIEEEARIGPRPVGNGLIGLLNERTAPLRLDILASHPRSRGFPPNHPPMASFLGVPIRRGDVVLGSLYLTNKEGGGLFTEADEAAVQALGSHAAVAIDNLHLITRQRALLHGLIMGQEEERRAVAYDLHDGLTQYVMAAHAHFQTTQRLQTVGDMDLAAKEMALGMGYLEHAVDESRRLVNGLRSLTLDDLGLPGALEQLLQEEKTRAGWKQTQFTNNVDGIRYDITLETTAYRVAQEALNNVRKHARADKVHMTLLTEKQEPDRDMLRLEVQDWGVGFRPEEELRETQHVGLHSMAERVSLLGGTYTLQSSPGRGTLIQAVFPAIKPAGEEAGG